MVARERHRHLRGEGDASVCCLDGAAHACAHRQDRRLRWADDCREFTHSIHTQIGNCCRSALIFVRLELPVACPIGRSEEHTSELQSLMRISYAVFCLTKKIKTIKMNT